jgi:hypothetical protein
MPNNITHTPVSNRRPTCHHYYHFLFSLTATLALHSGHFDCLFLPRKVGGIKKLIKTAVCSVNRAGPKYFVFFERVDWRKSIFIDEENHEK